MLKVLSIDDSRVVHAVLDDILSAVRAEVAHAFDGPSGLEMLSAGGKDFDVILLDWEMPKWTGIETLQKIRAAGISTPVIMLTSKNSPEDIAKAIEEGASEYAMKPFVSDIIYDKIEAVLGRSVR